MGSDDPQATAVRDRRYRLAFFLRDLHWFLLLGTAGAIGLNGNLWLKEQDGVMGGSYLEPIPVDWWLLWTLVAVILVTTPVVLRLPAAALLGKPSLALRNGSFLRAAKDHGWQTGPAFRYSTNRLLGYTSLMVLSWAGALLMPWTALRLVLAATFALMVHLFWKQSALAQQERGLDATLRPPLRSDHATA